MIKFNYHNDYIELFLETPSGEILKFDNWLSVMDNPACFNVINDLTVNGIANFIDSERVSINYDDISQIDSFEYDTLGFPKPYPYDIFIDILGGGLRDVNLKIRFYFQDFSHGNGSGENLFYNKHRIGAYLNNELEFLLNSNQFTLIKAIEKFNQSQFSNSTSVLKELSKIQELATIANAVLSKILVDTSIVTPEKIKFEITPIDNNKYKLSPIVEKVNSQKFQSSFELYPRVKSEYSIKDDNKKVRVLIDDEENEESKSLKTELQKLKRKSIFNGDEINEIYNNLTNFWDSDLIDLDDFSKRVLELGIYKPRFYPFISPYKSEWIPGIVIDDKKEGTRHVSIKNQKEFEELKLLVHESKKNGNSSVSFKGEDIDLTHIDSILDNAHRQLSSPQKPITTIEKEREKPDSETKVLIIKENAEENEYTEVNAFSEDVRYKFQQINNLSSEILLKEHQKNGIAWLQTLSNEPYSLPGVLLADDMGLGKTLQVLYFIEWFNQINKSKPVLIIAPVSLLENWQNEYEKFFPAPSLKALTLWGSNVKNYIIPNNKQQTISNLSDSAIYLTTYETLRKQQIPLGLINWGVVVLDEAQKVKTPGTFVTNAAKALKADFKIAMTGTPVENSLMDLWCIIDFCSPGLLENAKEFSKQYQKPLSNEKTDLEQISEDLRNRIGVTLLRRMKFDVAKDLPSIEYLKHEESMPKIQFDSYLNELNSIEELKSQNESSNPVLQGIFNLRSISDHPYLKHYQIEKIETDRLINSSAKLKKVISILSDINQKGEKAIIFTENKSMQRVLRKTIAEYFKIIPSIINGETPTSKAKFSKAKLTRQQEIDKYQDVKGFNVIIMSPVAAGFGLNITEANHVIHYTRHWNPAKEQQATDRAYRIGQKKPVKVYYPLAVAPNNNIKTFDIILDELLQRKSHLASRTLFPTEQIEISKNDFITSMSFDSSTKMSVDISSIDDLDQLNPLSFEAAVAILFEKMFNGNSFLTPVSNDKGADIVFFGENANYLIQVKQSSSALGISSGQEIKYAIPEYKSKYAREFIPTVVSNSFYTQNAIDLAQQNDIELIDRNILKKWIKENHLNTSNIDKKINERI